MVAVLRANHPNVVHETIDGETILIHLQTGTYYSLDGAGSEAWELLAPGATRETLLEGGRGRYLGDPLEVEMGLASLIDELLREELLVEIEAPEEAATPTTPTTPATPATRGGLPAGRVPFAVPVLQAYTDMQEFMVVDPLHEVDELAGWPHLGGA